MNKQELRELIMQELMARPAGIVKSSPEKVNINDLADVAQRSFDNIFDMLDTTTLSHMLVGNVW
jgi:hypothetical protein